MSASSTIQEIINYRAKVHNIIEQKRRKYTEIIEKRTNLELKINEIKEYINLNTEELYNEMVFLLYEDIFSRLQFLNTEWENFTQELQRLSDSIKDIKREENNIFECLLSSQRKSRNLLEIFVERLRI